MSADSQSDEQAQSDRESVVFTRGVSSLVVDEDGDEMGHVALLDCDDADPLAVHRAASGMDGRTAVYQSSDGSFHLWNLRVREFDASILDALTLRIADADHIQQSKIRERYVLRVAPKVREDETLYKDAPTLLDVYDDGECPVSAAHEWLVQQHAERDHVTVTDVADERLVGDAEKVEIHTYMTLTDAGKEAIR